MNVAFSVCVEAAENAENAARLKGSPPDMSSSHCSKAFRKALYSRAYLITELLKPVGTQ